MLQLIKAMEKNIKEGDRLIKSLVKLSEEAIYDEEGENFTGQLGHLQILNEELMMNREERKRILNEMKEKVNG